MTVQDIPMPPLLRAEPERNRWGQYVLLDPVTGQKRAYQRVSTLKSMMQDTYGLNQWKVRTTLQGLAYHQLATAEQVAQVGGSRIMDRLVELIRQEDDLPPTDFNQALNKLAEEAFDIGGGKWAADMGTALHAWCEFVDLGIGTVEDVPELFRPYVQAYLDELAAHGIVVLPDFIERIVVNLVFEVAGTFDRIYRLADDTLAVGDIKSGKDIRYGWLEIAQQMAAYETAEYMLDDNDDWVPTPDVRGDFAVIAHVPVTNPTPKCDLVLMPLAPGREALITSADVRTWRKEKFDQVAGNMKLPAPDSLLVAAINQATSTEDLAALYEQHSQIWTDAHTLLGKRRMAKVQQSQ